MTKRLTDLPFVQVQCDGEYSGDGWLDTDGKIMTDVDGHRRSGLSMSVSRYDLRAIESAISRGLKEVMADGKKYEWSIS